MVSISLVLSLAAFAVALGVGLLPTVKMTDPRRERERSRRRISVRIAPVLATYADAEDLLADVVGWSRARELVALAQETQTPAGLLVGWAREHGADLLALVLAARFTHADLLAHRHTATELDVESLELLAELHGRPLSQAEQAQLVPVRRRQA